MTGTKTDFLTHSAFDYKSIIFDFDSTIIKTESLDKLAQSALADHPNQKNYFRQNSGHHSSRDEWRNPF